MSDAESPPRPLARAVLGALRVPAGFAVGAVAVLALMPLVLDGPGDRAPQPTVAAERTQEDEAARLVRTHDCWTGEAPEDMADRLPGHVVLTHRVDGQERTTYGADRLVGVALEHLFTAPDPQVLAVHGFCR